MENRWKKQQAETRVDYVRKFCPSGKLLEVGCADGGFLNLSSRYHDCHGVEPCKITSQYARRKYDLNVITGTLTNANYEGESFDIVVMWHVLEHLSAPSREIEEIPKVLKSEGYLIIETPNIDNI